MKKVLGVYTSPAPHWVGDGFPVRSILSRDRQGDDIDPFLLLDHAGPLEFPASHDERPGVGEHPHRGFETVTIVYQGEVEHRDSAGNSGKIGPGDVQWMTAAAGVVHEEKHSRAFTQRGGMLEMVQLWVNLPARLKMSPPKYQTLLKADIPVVEGESGVVVRVIAGDYRGKHGPAHTATPLNVWDVTLASGRTSGFAVPERYSATVVVLHGRVVVNEAEAVRGGEAAVLDRNGAGFSVTAQEDSALLILSGEPLGEPVVQYGPFVMNTDAEIAQAMLDYRSGRMGTIDLRIKPPRAS